MSDIYQSFKLYDTDILDLLWSGPSNDVLTRTDAPEDYEGVFDDLQEKELIYAIYRKNHREACRLLNMLNHTLSPTDAMAACLCAIACNPNLLDRILDHCPPIPDFQFQGEGHVSSLLNVVVDFRQTAHLDLLLNRGADPNGGPTPSTKFSPLEFAFCSTLHHSHGYYDCLKRLLEAPNICTTPTTDILNAWGQLEENWDPEILQSCRLLYEHITGRPADPEDPLPHPPQMTLKHTLWRGNRALAARISGEHPITEEDRETLLELYSKWHPICLLHANEDELFIRQEHHRAKLLTHFLTQHPDALQFPEVRSELAAASISLPKPDPNLQQWVAQLEDGPVFLQQLPIIGHLNGHRMRNDETPVLNPDFFPRWDARLGKRLVPMLRPMDIPCMEALSAEDIASILRRVQVTDESTSRTGISPLAMRVLLEADEEVLAELLQPGGALHTLSADALLNACHALPPTRRTFVLLHFRKEASYTL